jgi:hypothetical protein
MEIFTCHQHSDAIHAFSTEKLLGRFYASFEMQVSDCGILTQELMFLFMPVLNACQSAGLRSWGLAHHSNW